MKSISEILDQKVRGEDITPNPNNKVTKRRKGLHSGITNTENPYEVAMETLRSHVTRLQEYVLSHSEEPMSDLRDLVMQVYELRMREVSEANEMFDFDNEEGITHLEQQEAEFYDDNEYVRDEFLGELFAPVEIAYTHLKNNKPDGFIDPAIIGGIINLVGGKVNKATLIRAAQGKNVGILGNISTGGKKHYTALVAYFKAHPDIQKKVVAGEITDESQLPDWTPPVNPNTGVPDPINKIGDDIAKTQLKKYLPYIIVGVVLLVVVIYFAARSKK